MMKELENRIAIALCAAAFVGSVFAIDDLPVPNADGKIVLNTAGGEYAATADVVCTQVVFSANNISLDLSADGGKTISIPSTVTTDGFSISARDFTASVSGGVWDFGGGANMTVGKFHNDAITFSGTKVRNVKNVTIGSNFRNCTLTLSDSAEFDAESMRIASSSNGGRCKFEVLDGATATINGNFFPEDNAGYGDNCLIVDGVGSSLSVPNKDVVLGSNLSNDRMSISNGGSAALQSLTVGNGGSATNTVLTVDGASLTLGGNLVIGNSDSSCNKVCIKGATTRFQRGNPSGSDPYFGTGGFNEFHVTGGTIITNEFNKNTYIGYQSSNNVVRISDGATMVQKDDNTVYLGYNYNDEIGSHNAFAVDAGGTNKVNRFIICGHDNHLVISNGTFATRRTLGGSLWVGNTVDGAENPRNNGVILSGTSPRLQIPGGLTLQNESYLRFELAENGYAAGVVPVSVKDATIASGSSIEVETAAYLASNKDSASKVELIRATDTLDVDDSVIASANAALPDRCKLIVEGNSLFLKVSSGKGLVVSVR